MERFDLENFPTSESAKRMLSYVSEGFYDNSYVGKWLYQVMGMEYDKALEIVMNLPEQFFPETATWGLLYHELKWGLPIREDLQYEERRKLIYEKRDCHAPMTPYRMEKYLETMTGFKVCVSDAQDIGRYGFIASHPNEFKVYFTGERTLDSKLVHQLINKIKQSHTVYTVNDRVEVGIEQSDLEKAVCSKLYVKMEFYFFGMYLLNGRWRLDGSVRLCQRPIRVLNTGIIIGAVKIRSDERVGNIKVTVRKDLWYLDGGTKLDGSRKLDAEVREEEL